MQRGFPSNIILKDAVITNVSLKPYPIPLILEISDMYPTQRVYCYMVIIPVLYVFMHIFSAVW